MVWRKATAWLTGERQHPVITSHPSTGQGLEPEFSSPAPQLCHITPSAAARCATFCCCTKADGVLGLARGRAKGTPPEIAQLHGVAGAIPLVKVDGGGVTAVPPMWQ